MQQTLTGTISNIHAEALTLQVFGMSPIPIQPGGRKTPPFSWKQYQDTAATLDEINAWHSTHPEWGLAVITGAVSGNLEMIELEGRARELEKTLAERAAEMGIQGLWERVQAGWKETTPTGGIHWYYRVSGTPVLKNTKLARTADHIVLAETRGEGGLSVIAPTAGNCHTNRRAWGRVAGGPAHTPILSAEEYAQIHILFATLDEAPENRAAAQPLPHPTTSITIDGVRPGDDIENKITWEEILEPHGWQKHSQHGEEIFWTRPGKNPRDGHSASTGHAGDRDRLYVWSSSTPFTPETPYTKFMAYTILNHNGNPGEAAKALAEQGYGTEPAKVVFDIPMRNTQKTENPGETTDSGNVDIQPAPGISFLNTEDYDALAFVEQHENTIAYCPEQARWYHWTGHKWEQQPQGGGYLRELMRQYARKLPQDDTSSIKYKKTVSTHRGISNRLALAQTDPRIVIPQNEFDNHPFELNTPQNTVNLQTGETTPNYPLHYHSRSTTITPQRTPTPMWDRFLTQTFAEDTELISFMQRLVGYSATGRVTHHILPFLYGPGGNGKSVFLDLIIRILGDYATSTPAGFLMAGQQKHETEIAQLSGVRFAVSSEVNETDRFDEAKVKLLTGGDTLKARYMHKDYFSFIPTHTLWLMGNHQPRVQSGGASFWRRLLLIGFTNTVRDEDRIEGLSDILYEQEGAGILQWIIDGAVACHRDGLNPPEKVRAASREYAEEEDTLARFVEDCIIVGGGEYARVNTAEMRAVYSSWCTQNGHREMSAQAFGRELKNRFGITTIKSNSIRYYTNVTLADTSEEESNSWNDLGGAK